MDIEKFLGRPKMTVKALAEAAGVSRQIIYRILNGQGNPTIDTAVRIETATGGQVTANELLHAVLPRGYRLEKIPSNSRRE